MSISQCTVTCTTDCGHCKGRPVATLRAELAALRQQLDEARAERDALREQAVRYPVPAVATDLHDMVAEALRPYLTLVDDDDECWEVTVEGASGLADLAIEALISAARLPGVADEHVMFEYRLARDQVERFAERINAAEADRDRLLVVYRAAQAWRRHRNFERRSGEINPDLLAAHQEDLDLARAVDWAVERARREDAAWTPAKEGQTPGELVPGEREQVLPVDGAS